MNRSIYICRILILTKFKIKHTGLHQSCLSPNHYANSTKLFLSTEVKQHCSDKSSFSEYSKQFIINFNYKNRNHHTTYYIQEKLKPLK